MLQLGLDSGVLIPKLVLVGLFCVLVGLFCVLWTLLRKYDLIPKLAFVRPFPFPLEGAPGISIHTYIHNTHTHTHTYIHAYDT
jgi:hypothetical protein